MSRRGESRRAPRRWRAWWPAMLVAPLLAIGGPTASTVSAASEGECSTAPNPVACENALPGAPKASWQVKGIGDANIQGYATSMSVNVGSTVDFKIKTNSTKYHIDILRLGFYHGNGARLIAAGIKPSATLPQTQPACLTQSTGLIDCGNWSVSASWSVPSTAVSGIYIAHLVPDDNPASSGSQIIFIVRNDASHSDILMQTSDATWEAYNAYGGNSLYSCTVSCPAGEPEAYKAAFAVSYNRPFDGSFPTDNGNSYLYYAEYQMLYWLEENGFNVSYTSEAEVQNQPALLKNHKVFLSSGHDEYWSAGQREAVEAARDAGVNLAFFSGNEIFWKTRWANSIDGTSTHNRTLITYKETHFNAPVDPSDPPVWTGSWRDPRFSPPGDGGKPENSLTGQYFLVNAGSGDITVPSTYSKLRFWRGTAVSTLASGQSLTLAPEGETLGYEWDEDVDNGFRPAGEMDMSSTTMSGLQTFIDYGSKLNGSAESGEPGEEPTQGNGSTATHHLTLYRAPSGALVFGAGTVQWSWGLAFVNAWDAGTTEQDETPPDRNLEQATVNLLADMGAQPATLISGLNTASKSTDTQAPTSAITSPAAGANLSDGSNVTISGTATDTGGGVVAGVEVSTDGGTTWHPASLTSGAATSATWSYTWAAHGNPTTTIRSRAVDDSANLESPGAGRGVNVACPCSIWGAGVTPPAPDSGDAGSVELGVKFTSSVFGTVTGIRFYKSSLNTGTHVGSLWSAGGTLLAQATFSGESASGWQQVNFSTPVNIEANTTYVAAYLAPNGHYADSLDYFFNPPPTGGNALNSPPLKAVAANVSTTNGLYSYTSSSTFPTSTFSATNYYVDVAFTPGAVPGQVTNVKATAGSGSAEVSWSAPSTGGPVTTYTVTPFIGETAQTPVKLTGSPPLTSTTVSGLKAGTAYTFKVQASNPTGPGPVSAPSNSVTPSGGEAPGAPTGVSAQPASSRAVVSWTAPGNGGSPITGYTVTPFIGANAQTPVPVSGSPTSTTITGLTNGTGYTFKVSATNAIGTGPQSAASNAVIPEDTIFDFATPPILDAGDSNSVELGVKFSSEVPGEIVGIRFYKATANTGVHVGSLWTSGGTQLAQATFSGESASGWQQVTFSSPVQITANTTYVAAYFAPSGHYSVQSAGFGSGSIENAPLRALANTITPDGVFSYSGSSTFPNNNFNANNYFVDVMFTPGAAPTPEAPGAPTGVSASPGSTKATVSWTAPGNGGSPITGYTVTPFIGANAQTPVPVSGSQTSTTITGLTNGTSYTFKVSATNAIGTGPQSAASNAVTPSNVISIFEEATPPTPDAGDKNSVELGVKFSSEVAGEIVGIRFYKATANTGVHVGSLWTAGGTQLAQATFTGEGASGWQQVTFSNPVPINANTTYVAAYFAPNGHYSVQSAGFGTASIENPPLRALANTITPDGIYSYAGSSTFPSSSFNASNYYVDVTFIAGAAPTPEAPPAPTGVVATAASGRAQVSWTPAGNGGSPITGYTVTPFIGANAQTPVPVSASQTSTAITGLTNGTSYTFKVSATNAIGTGPQSAASNGVTPEDTIFEFATPPIVDAGDGNSVVLGVKFSSEVAGEVTGIRFYKATANTGTHVGSLWTSGGTLLAQATFSSESASGWQQVTFSKPVQIAANTTFVAAYLAPNGHYSVQAAGFGSASTENPPLKALANTITPDGVYAYSAGSVFPTNSFNSNNYYVDVMFTPGP